MARAPQVVAVVVVACASALAGCQGCTPRSAGAQEPDGGAPVVQQRIVVVPVPIPQEPQPEPDAPATCYERASARTTLTEAQIATLCIGAWSAGPVACYVDARRRIRLSDDQQITLCRCADSAQPVACFRRVDRDTGLTDDQILSLCAPTIALGLTANCRAAWGG